MSQKTRVLRALQAVGGKGICATDFLAPNVCDGEAPVTRLAARINELRDEGHEIIDAGIRDSCRVYRLVAKREVPDPLPPLHSPLVLEVGAGTPYDRWSDAA